MSGNTGELQYATATGKKKTSPGPDGINHEFYLTFWDVISKKLLEIINTMYIGPSIQDSRKHGLIVCLPKHGKATRIEEFRPLMILNTDLKLLSRIIANHLNPWLPNLLTPDQHCGLTGTTIYDALATIREVVARWLPSLMLKENLCASYPSNFKEHSMQFHMSTWRQFSYNMDIVSSL
jgi:hypothetical protein